MKIWVSCECDGYAGDLTSIALVDENGNQWQWQEKTLVKKKEMRQSLEAFLSAYCVDEIWPTLHLCASKYEDIELFCCVITDHQEPLRATQHWIMEICGDLKYLRKHSRNALEGAKELKRAWVNGSR